jgi:hypothetical protein
LKKDGFRQSDAVVPGPQCSTGLVVVRLTTLLDCEKQALNQRKESTL